MDKIFLINIFKDLSNIIKAAKYLTNKDENILRNLVPYNEFYNILINYNNLEQLEEIYNDFTNIVYPPSNYYFINYHFLCLHQAYKDVINNKFKEQKSKIKF